MNNMFRRGKASTLDVATADSFATMAALAAVDVTGVPFGTTVTTVSPPATWRLAAWGGGSSFNLRAMVYAATAAPKVPGDNGVWFRDCDVGAPGVIDFGQLFVDSVAGNDDSSGADVSPLKSIDEVLYRIGKQTIDGATVGTMYVYLQGDFTGPMTIDVRFKNDGALAFVGTRTVVASYVVSAVTPWNSATGVIGSYTFTGAPDLTARVGQFVRINAGATTGNKAPIAKAISAGVFRASWAQQADGVAVEPAVNDTVDAYSVNHINGDIRIASGPPGTNGGTVLFEALELGQVGQDHSVVVSNGQATFTACKIHGLDFYEGVTEGVLNLCYVVECRSYGFIDVSATTFATIGGTPLSMRGNGIGRITTRSLIQGGGLAVGHNLEGPGHLLLNAPMACVDYAGDGLLVQSGSTAILGDVLTLRDAVGGSTVGGHVLAGGQALYATGKTPVIVGNAPVNDYTVGGTNYAKASIPVFSTVNGATVGLLQ